MEPVTAGLMLPPATMQSLSNDLGIGEQPLNQQCPDRPQPVSNLLKRRQQHIPRIDIEGPVKRPRANSQRPGRPPTPFPRNFVGHPLLLSTGNEINVASTATTTSSSSPESLSPNSVNSRTRYMPLPQLSAVVDALTCLQKNIEDLSSKPGGPTSHEMANLATKLRECILPVLSEVDVNYAARVRRAEEDARAQLIAEFVARLHAMEQQWL